MTPEFRSCRGGDVHAVRVLAGTVIQDHRAARERAMNEALAAAIEMRAAQRHYFSKRTQGNLIIAKEAEARFDRLAAALLSRHPAAIGE